MVEVLGRPMRRINKGTLLKNNLTREMRRMERERGEEIIDLINLSIVTFLNCLETCTSTCI